MAEKDTAKTTFFSLKVKIILMITIVLLVLHGGYSFISYQYQLDKFEHERWERNKRDMVVLDGLLQSSYLSLVEMGELFTLLSVDSASEQLTPLEKIELTVDRDFDRLTLNGAIDSVYLFNASGVQVKGWGQPLPISERVIEKVMREERPYSQIVCSADCLRYVALPVRVDADNTAVMVIARTLVDIILSFSKQSGRDIGLAFKADPSASDLHAWSLRLKYLTQKAENLQVLQALSVQQAFSVNTGPSYLDFDSRYYEVVVREPESVDAGTAYWIFLEDLTEEYNRATSDFLKSLATTIVGMVLAAIGQLLLLNRSMSELVRITRLLPLLAKGRYAEVRDQLAVKEGQRTLNFSDELDDLRISAVTLSEQLEALGHEVDERERRLYLRGQQLKNEKDFVNSLLTTAQAIILTQNEEGRVITINPFGQKLLSLKEGDPFALLLAEGQRAEAEHREAQRMFMRLKNKKDAQVRIETAIYTADEDVKYITWVHSRLNDTSDSAARILSIGVDITERRAVERKLRWSASHDLLTGLPNRKDVEQRLTEAFERTKDNHSSCAVLLCDMDGFKDVNDSLNHSLGDELIRAAAGRLRSLMQEGEYIARMDGDEFLIIREGMTSRDELESLAERITTAFQEVFVIGEFKVYSTLSVGVAVYPEHSKTPDTLLQYADIAIRQAKERGKNQHFIFNQSQGSGRDERFVLASDLHGAARRGEMRLHYQPQINKLTGQVIGLEALLRWQHPEAGIVMPDTFIPLAEEQGLIIEIGEWALREACNQTQVWRAEGFDSFKIGVNLAGQQLMHQRIIEVIDSALQESGLPPEYLDLEVTESYLIRQPELLVPKLLHLKAKGITFSLDDFGTGYSSFSYLKQLPVDRLKIDKSFVQDLGKQNGDESIVMAIISLCNGLGLDVIAEGVDSVEQQSFLVESGCHTIQGYLYSKPLSAEKTYEYLVENKKALAEKG